MFISFTSYKIEFFPLCVTINLISSSEMCKDCQCTSTCTISRKNWKWSMRCLWTTKCRRGTKRRACKRMTHRLISWKRINANDSKNCSTRWTAMALARFQWPTLTSIRFRLTSLISLRRSCAKWNRTILRLTSNNSIRALCSSRRYWSHSPRAAAYFNSLLWCGKIRKRRT